MSTLISDLRFGIRLLVRSPAVTLIAVLTLALGIGANTAIFSVVHAVVMRPLPYPNSERLVQLYTQFPNMKLDKFWFSVPEYIDLAGQARSYESVGAYQIAGAPVIGGEMPVRAVTAYCTPSLLPTMGVQPILGRFFTTEEDIPEQPQGVLLSWGLWQRLFGGDPGVINRSIRVDSGMTRVVGVMPQGFTFPGDGVELWVPSGLKYDNNRRGSHAWSVVGRLEPGVSPGQARAELTSLETAWAGRFPHSLDTTNHMLALHPLMGEVVGTLRSPLLVLQGAVFFVLLIACANISGLLLARAEGRSREMAIRVALGAGRARLARQLLTESLILGVVGGGLGLLFAAWGLDFMMSLVPPNAPRMHEVRIDGAVLAFTIFASIGTSVVFGLAPIVHVGAAGFAGSLTGAGRSSTAGLNRQRLRRALVVAEMALAVVLVVASGLMIQSFSKVMRVDVGFEPHGLLTFQIELPHKEYPDAEKALQLWSTLQSRLGALPGVRGVTVMAGLPPSRHLNANDIFFEGKTPSKDGPVWNVDFFQTVGSDYFRTMGIRMVAGREFDKSDNGDGMPVALVNQTFVKRFYPGEEVIGRRVRPGNEGPWLTVVGVVRDVKRQGIDAPTGTEIYFSLPQIAKLFHDSSSLLNVAVRTDLQSPRMLESGVRRVVGDLDGTLAIARLATMDELMYDAVSKPRFVTTLLGVLAGLALLLAAIGIYGVMSYSVAQRTKELGIRMALGAEAGQVRTMVLLQGMRLAFAGIAIGTGAALAINLVLQRALSEMLFQVSAVDPWTFGAVTTLMVLVAGLACYAPARRATRVDPMVALRDE